MKFLPLVWSNLRRRWVRTAFTLLSLVVAFMLLATLMAIRTAFSGVTVAGADRLMVMAKIALINPVPIGYQSILAGMPGVTGVTHANWFGGVYQDSTRFFANLAVDPDSWLRLHPEFVVAPEQRTAWLRDRTGAMVGADTARRFGWAIGDRVPLQGTIYRRPDGRPWEFTIDAIYTADASVDQTQFFLHYDYLNETLPEGSYGKNEVSWFLISLADASGSEEAAARIDRQFANSSYETKTATEKAFVSSFARQIGEIGPIVIAIASAVLFMILLVCGNTMAQAIRERSSELAVLRTLGFRDVQIVALVLTESCLVAFAGGSIGLALSWLAITLVGDPTHGLLPPIHLSTDVLVAGTGLMAVLGIATGIIPAIQARRPAIVDALRRQ